MKIVISSRHFNPAYIGHMKAWYNLCVMCNYSVKLFFAIEYEAYFKDENYRYCTTIEDVESFSPDCAVVQNIGIENIELFKWCKKNKCYLFYILHEPYVGIKEMMKEGDKVPKHFAAHFLNLWLCKKADKVIICSKYASNNCKKYMRSIFKKTVVVPLLFMNDYDDNENVERKYFSMVGTYAISHGSDVFLEFIKKTYMNGLKMYFQIATRSDITNILSDPVYKQMESEGLLLVQQGRPLTEREICNAYRRSYVVWNGYRRSTQSGVLPNSYMQGTPVIATHLLSFEEFVKPGVTGVFINSFEYDDIHFAVSKIMNSEEYLNKNCRDFFMSNFYYASQVNTFCEIMKSINKSKK